MSGKVYAVASGKGGVGKTTTVVNLGVTLRADDHSVVLVDADLGMANLGTFLGIDHEPTLHDVLAGEATLDEAMTEQADRFAILPGARGLREYADADPTRLGSVLEELAERYEYVLVDTGAGVGYDDILPLELVDEVVLVATPDGAALGDASKTAEIAALVGSNVRGVVITRTGEGDDPEAIAERMGVELLAAIPDDPAVPRSTASGRPLEAFAPESDAADGYRRLAATLTGRDVERFEPPESTGAPATEGGSEAAESAASEDASDAAPDDEPVDTDRNDDDGAADADAAAGEQGADEAGEASVESATDASDDADAAGDTDTERGEGTEQEDDSEPSGDEGVSDGDDGDEDAAADDGTSGGFFSRLRGLFG